MGRPVIATVIMTRESQADSPKNPNEQNDSRVGSSGLKGTYGRLTHFVSFGTNRTKRGNWP